MSPAAWIAGGNHQRSVRRVRAAIAARPAPVAPEEGAGEVVVMPRRFAQWLVPNGEVMGSPYARPTQLRKVMMR